MFSDYEYSGKHMMCDFKNIKNTGLLKNCDELRNLLLQICSRYNFTILSKSEHIFTPIGCTILFLLSESHISIHTFPEKQHIAFDIYTCRQYKDDTEYKEIFDYLIERLDASRESNCSIINRNF